MQSTSVKFVAEIFSGKSFRSKPEHIKDGGCHLIQMKDISIDGFVETPMSIELNDVNPAHLLRRGDLLFVAKGNKNYALVYDSDMPAVAISLFFVLRPKSELVDFNFLAWYINSSKGQQYFEQHRMGASVGNIRKSVLENIPIVLPELAIQKQISQLDKSVRIERVMTQQYLQKKETYVNQSILNLIEAE